VQANGTPALVTPDFRGGSIVNLMASIVRARGGESDYPDLRLLPPTAIAHATNLVLLVLDGLGYRFLLEQLPGGVMARHLRGSLTSVFPSATVAAVTSFLTAEAPQQHALTGWYTHLRELGCVMTVFPGHPRHGGVGYRKSDLDPVQLFGHLPVFDRIRTRSLCLCPQDIADSDFNRAHLGRAELLAFDSLRRMFRRAERAIRAAADPKYLYLYWPRLDAIGHAQGMGSPAARAHAQEIQGALTDFLDAVSGTDTQVLVTADHGQIDTTAADRIDLADHPELAACLALPPCGEPRAAFCYLRPSRVARFEAYCREVLGDKLDLIESQALIDQGLFGLGEPHPRLAERVGDVCLLMRGHGVIEEPLPNDRRPRQVGVHGGLRAAEVEVPLCVFGV